MSLPKPILDNVVYEELVKEAKSLIPIYAPEWTNHNPSDPGITLIELFAWLCEMIIYRIDQVPEKNYLRFLKLLGIQLNEGEEISSGIRRGVNQLSERTRAVTMEDFEVLAYKGLMEKPGILEKYPDIAARTICLVNRNLENAGAETLEQFGHISIILVIKTENQKDFLRDAGDIKQYVKQYLSSRKLLTTHIHVVDPEYREVKISIQVAAKEKTLENTVREVVEKYLDPITGGENGSGWPQGRKLYNSDLFYLMERIQGIDHVIRVDLDVPDFKPYQLIKIKELVIEVES
jgi:hypothetical protein